MKEPTLWNSWWDDDIVFMEDGRVVVDGIISKASSILETPLRVDTREIEARESYERLTSWWEMTGEERKEIIIHLEGSEYGYEILETKILSREERENIIGTLKDEHLYKHLVERKISQRERIFCLNLLILKARGEYAYKTLLNIPGISPSMKIQLIQKLWSKYSFHALADVENLSEAEKRILRRNLLTHISPEYAYRALDKIPWFSKEERIKLIESLWEFAEFTLSITDLNIEERKLIQQIYFS